MIAAPLFHSWGFSHFILGLPLAATMVLRRRFDPEDTLRAIAEHGAETLAVVPVMMQRILELPDEVRPRYDALPLRVTAASGSALPGELATKLDGRVRRQPLQPLRLDRGRLGDDRDARGHAGGAGHGRPDAARAPWSGSSMTRATTCPQGETGRIFVGNDMSFEGYTGGGDKERLDELLSSGDVGHFDQGGRLFIDGRDDEMIVSGGENVFPREVEDLLAEHEAVDGGRRDRGGRRGVRPAPARVRRAQRTGPSVPRRSSRRTSSPISPATRFRARSSSSTSFRATPQVRC